MLKLQAPLSAELQTFGDLLRMRLLTCRATLHEAAEPVKKPQSLQQHVELRKMPTATRQLQTH